MPIIVRPIVPDELAPWFSAIQVGFSEVIAPSEELAEFRRPFAEYPRILAALDGDQIVGTFRSFATQLTLPGGCTLAADAITAVTVRPTHRRRGALTAMMTQDLRAAADRGEPLAILIASEWPIYGRYGFGLSCDDTTLTFEPKRILFRNPTPGTVELVDVTTLRELAPPVYDRFRLAQPGSLEREPRWWDINLDILHPPGRPKWQGWQGVYRSDRGDAEGYVRYHVDQKWEGHVPRSTLNVDELIAATPAAYARLWRFVSEIDLIGTVRAETRPAEEPLRWLLVDGQAVSQSLRSAMLWIRVLDPIAALSARRSPTEGRVVLDVTDEAGFAQGRFALEAGPDGAAARRTRERADVRLPAASLGAILLGGRSLRLFEAAGLVEEGRSGGLDRVDALFRSPVEPWCATWF